MLDQFPRLSGSCLPEVLKLPIEWRDIIRGFHVDRSDAGNKSGHYLQELVRLASRALKQDVSRVHRSATFGSRVGVRVALLEPRWVSRRDIAFGGVRLDFPQVGRLIDPVDLKELSPEVGSWG